MALNEKLHKALVGLGIKKSEKQLIEEAIEQHENNAKDCNDRIENLISEIVDIENRIAYLKTKYDGSHGATKKTYEAQIRSTIKELNSKNEVRDIAIRKLELEKTCLHNKKLELDALLNPTDVFAIEDAIERKHEIMEDLKEEDRYVAELDSLEYQRESSSDAPFSEYDSDSDSDNSDDLDSLLADILDIPPASDDDNKNINLEQ